MQLDYIVFSIHDSPVITGTVNDAGEPILEMRFAEIVRVGDCPQGHIDAQAGPGEGAIEGTADLDTQYVIVEDGIPRLANKPYMQLSADKTEVAADNTDTLLIRNVPDGAMATIKDAATGETLDAADSDNSILELTFITPLVYLIVVSKFPYIDGQIQIAAV